jgi:hypothetical protein
MGECCSLVGNVVNVKKVEEVIYSILTFPTTTTFPTIIIFPQYFCILQVNVKRTMLYVPRKPYAAFIFGNMGNSFGVVDTGLPVAGFAVWLVDVPSAG